MKTDATILLNESVANAQFAAVSSLGLSYHGNT